MVTLDLDGRIRCLDNQICPDIVYSPYGTDIDKASKIYEHIQNLERSIERNIGVPEEKSKLSNQLGEIYFDWIGKLKIDNEKLKIIEADVEYAQIERKLKESEKIERRDIEVDAYESRKRLPVIKYQNETEEGVNSLVDWDKKEKEFYAERETEIQELFEKRYYKYEDYSELDPSSMYLVREVKFLERYGCSNPKRSLERLKELESKLSLESDEWLRNELIDKIELLKSILSNSEVLLCAILLGDLLLEMYLNIKNNLL